MKKLLISIAIAYCVIATGCSVPDKPALRIAISTTPGSAVLYLAQELGLFKQYNVDVKLVELTTGCECSMALTDGSVDAVAVPYDELLDIRGGMASAGILMLLAASSQQLPGHDHVQNELDWYDGEIEVLAGKRSDLMLRRREWQQVLVAYEHARLLLAGEKEKQAEIIALREKRNADEFLRDLSEWSVFGVSHQDSLLGTNGPFKAMNAHWQGRKFLTAAAASRLSRDQSTESLKRHGSDIK